MKTIKYFACIIFLALIPISAQSILEDSIIFSAKTERPNYQYGDSITFIFTIENLSDTTVTLFFGSACQFDYLIDEFHFLDSVTCAAVNTYLIIPPDTTVYYHRYHNNSIYLPEIGTHNFTGILVGYDTASIMSFIITETTNTEEIKTEDQKAYILSQNYPNPFNPSTKIKFTIPSVTLRQAQSDNWVTLKVYDVLGNEIATLVNEEKQPGTYEVEFNPASSIKNPASGVYFYQLKSGNFVETKKMLLLK